jgi:hypothetical protein
MFSTWNLSIDSDSKEKFCINTNNLLKNFEVFYKHDTHILSQCYNDPNFTCNIPNYSNHELKNNGHMLVYDNGEYRTFIELSTFKLNLKKQKYTLLEKYVYDIAMFHIKRLNRTMDDNIEIEFWLTDSIMDHKPLHHDFQEMDKAILKKDIRPFLTTITYLNDNIYPTLITNIEYINSKNKHLDKIIADRCANDDKLDYQEIWSSIIANDGSVQHLDFLDDWTKDVYKTGMEIDQRWIVDHAAHRQSFIDQAQSINLFFRPDVNVKYLHAVHFLAWKQGLKTLYYCRSEKLAKADKVSKRIERKVIEELDMKQLASDDICLACEG